jgi:hypothetical protein
VISSDELLYVWNHRRDFIVIEGFILHEEELKYALEVLDELRLKRDDQYMHDGSIMKRILQAYNEKCGAFDTARKIEKENDIIMEYA